MKTNKTNILLLLIIAIFTFSCSSDDFEVENSNLINFDGKQKQDYNLIENEKNQTYYCTIFYDKNISNFEIQEFRDRVYLYRNISNLNNALLSNLNIDHFINPTPTTNTGVFRAIIFNFDHEEDGYDVFKISFTTGGPGGFDNDDDETDDSTPEK